MCKPCHALCIEIVGAAVRMQQSVRYSVHNYLTARVHYLTTHVLLPKHTRAHSVGARLVDPAHNPAPPCAHAHMWVQACLPSGSGASLMGRAKEGSPPPRKTGGPCRPRAKTEAPALAPAASKGSALKGRAMRLSKGSPKRSCTTRSLARLTGRACSLQVGAVWCAVGVQV